MPLEHHGEFSTGWERVVLEKNPLEHCSSGLTGADLYARLKGTFTPFQKQGTWASAGFSDRLKSGVGFHSQGHPVGQFISKVKVIQSCLTLCDPMNCSLPGFSVHGDSPGKNTGVGCHFLLQGNLPNPVIKPLSPALAGEFLPLRHQGSPILYWYHV